MSQRISRAERARRKRASGPVTETGGCKRPDPTETTADVRLLQGVGENPHIRGQLQEVRQLMRLGIFEQSQVDLMMKQLLVIVAKGNYREKISAMRTWLAATKLQVDLYRASIPGAQVKVGSVHGDVNVESNDGSTDVFGVAASLGLQVSIDEIGDEPGDIPGGSDSESPAIDGSVVRRGPERSE